MSPPTHNESPLAATYDDLYKVYDKASQAHVFKFYSTLSPSEQQTLLAQLSTIDVERVNRIFKGAMEAEKLEKSKAQQKTVEGGEKDSSKSNQDEILPLPSSACASLVPSPSSTPSTVIDQTQKWEQIGLAAIAKGQVGVLLMAGGQGTRLGSSSPKGCYDIGLPSGKSLFKLQAERIRKLDELAAEAIGSGDDKHNGHVNGNGNMNGNGSLKDKKGKITWYVMTSGPTRKETEEYFKSQKWFGLDEKNVIFFNQGVLPALSNDGKLLLSTPGSVSVAPDGNGGVYAAMRQPLSDTSDRSVLSDMHSRGIHYIHAYCVDNCLVRVADPVFIGYSIEKGSECGAKVVRKESPHESVGVLAMKGKAFSVVEYSELSKDKAELRDPETGGLAFRAANIANHFYTLEFLDKVEGMEASMAFHIARKKIQTVNLESGEIIKPSQPNGMKLELFVFDVFPFTHSLGVLEVERYEEFSPLKNAPGTGSDDPETSRRDLLAQQQRWLTKAGAQIGQGVEVEVSALVSYAGEGLKSVKGKTFVKSGVVETLADFEKLV